MTNFVSLSTSVSAQNVNTNEATNPAGPAKEDNVPENTQKVLMIESLAPGNELFRVCRAIW